MSESSSGNHEEEKRRKAAKAQIHRDGLVGVGNETKWRELLSLMRNSEVKTHYRCKSLNGEIFGWDGDWHYHIGEPLFDILWLDIKTVYQRNRGRLISPEFQDISLWLEKEIQKIGLVYEKGGELIRIFGYQPYDYELFETI